MVNCLCRECGGAFEWHGRTQNRPQRCPEHALARATGQRRAARQRWQEKNPEKQIAARKAWVEANKEKNRIAKLAWHAANRAKNVKYTQEYRGRLKAADGECSTAQLAARIAMYGGKCWMPGCGKPYEAIDHVIPLSGGGSNWPANMRPICWSHNSVKGARRLAA